MTENKNKGDDEIPVVGSIKNNALPDLVVEPNGKSLGVTDYNSEKVFHFIQI